MGRKSKGKGSDESVARERMAEVQANPAEHIGSEFRLDELLTEDVATAPTVACNEFVPRSDFDITHCARCGGTHEPVMTSRDARRADGLAAIREWEAEHGPLTHEDIDDARRLALDRRGAGPVKTYPLSVVVDEFVNAGLCVVGVDTLWYERAEAMAKEKGLTMTQFINGLIRGAWVARPLSKRGA